MDREESAPVQKHRPKAAVTPRAVRTFCSEELFQDDKEIVIEHAGEIYRLRITKARKLILYK